jgi:hypothetical protein
MAWTERYVDASAVGGGTGTSATDPWTLPEAVSNGTAGMRINIKAGTYSLSASISQQADGTVSSPIWWRGYKNTIGDLDLKSIGSLTDGTDIPRILTNNNLIIIDGNYTILSSIVFDNTGSSTRRTLYHRGSYTLAKNIKVKQVTGEFLLSTGGGDFKTYIGCNFVTSGTRTLNMITESASINLAFSDCIFQHEGTVSNSWFAVAVGHSQFTNCIFKNLPNGISAIYGSYHINNCTFVDISDDAIRVGTQNNSSSISNSYFANIGGYAIGATSSTAQGLFCIYNNVYQNCTGELESITENLQFNSGNDSSDLFVDSASGNYALQKSSVGYSRGRHEPTGGYWGVGSTDYSDVGAIQHANPLLGILLNSKHPLA